MEEPVGRRREALPEDELVRRWRRTQFVALGFTPREAALLTRARVDVGEVRRLLTKGCPLETARRIVL